MIWWLLGNLVVVLVLVSPLYGRTRRVERDVAGLLAREAAGRAVHIERYAQAPRAPAPQPTVKPVEVATDERESIDPPPSTAAVNAAAHTQRPEDDLATWRVMSALRALERARGVRGIATKEHVELLLTCGSTDEALAVLAEVDAILARDRGSTTSLVAGLLAARVQERRKAVDTSPPPPSPRSA